MNNKLFIESNEALLYRILKEKKEVKGVQKALVKIAIDNNRRIDKIRDAYDKLRFNGIIKEEWDTITFAED